MTTPASNIAGSVGKMIKLLEDALMLAGTTQVILSSVRWTRRGRGSLRPKVDCHAHSLTYISVMSKKSLRWRISRVRGAKAEQLGVVSAAHAKSAVNIAIKEFEVTKPEHQSQLAARPDA